MATGNSKAAKSARVKLQLRDKNGRWIEMGGGVKWYSPNLGKYMFGTAVDATDNGLAVVEVKNPNPNSSEKIFTVNIAPSQLEKVKSKASLDTNVHETIKPSVEKAEDKVEPAVEKNNKLFENMHKNPAGHDQPFGQDYESVPFDNEGTNNLQKNDLVVYSSEGTIKKGQVIGTDKNSGNPIIQPEVSSSWGFGGKGMPIPLAKIWDVYKPKKNSVANKASEPKADLPVPSVDKIDPKQIAQNLSGPAKTAEEKAQMEKEIADYKDVKGNYEKYKNGVPSGLSKQSVIAKKQQAEKEAAEQDAEVKKDVKLTALMDAEPGTRLLSNDGETVNLVKQEAGHWTQEGTGKNYTSTEILEEFAGEKDVSVIPPEVDAAEVPALKSQAQKLEQEAAEADTAAKKDAKLNALMAAKTGTRLLSADEKTINLVKQDAGYWTEEGTGTNYTSTQVVEQFAGEKSVSMIEPEPVPLKPGELSSSMTADEFKKNLSAQEQADIDDNMVMSFYTPASDVFKNYPGYTAAEEYAIMDYVGDSSMLNQALRLDNSNVTEYRNIIAGMDSLLKKSPITEAITVWRGIRANPTMFDEMFNNGTYKDLGFSASSMTEQVARNWITGGYGNHQPVTLKISLPAGFHAHKVDYTAGGGSIADFDEEDEVVLPRNTMFKVVSMNLNVNGVGYTAELEPVITKENSTGGAENDGSNTGETGNTGDTGTKADTDATGNGSAEESGTLPNNSGNDNISDGGASSGGSGEAEPAAEEPGQGNETGPIAEAPAEVGQELGKLYSDDKGQYMLGTDGQKFRNGDKVSYTKKGVTEEGKIVALYEGVKSARVEFPDGSKNVKKISALTSLETATEADTAPVEAESAPAVEVPEAAPIAETIEDYETPGDLFDKEAFGENYPIAVEDLPVGTVLKLKSNPEHALKKVADGDWRHANSPSQRISNEIVKMAQGLMNGGKPSYDIHMPKTTTAPETAPVAEAPTTQDVPEVDMVVPETTVDTPTFTVEKNINATPGSFHVKTKDKSKMSVSVADLKEGDVIYPVGTQQKPYATHGNYTANQAFINATHPAGMGTVIKNDPKKPYIQVKGTDGEVYFPSKNFVATKQSDEIDNLISELEGTPAFEQAKKDAVEEIAAPEELAEMEEVTVKSPVDVSSWKKLKNSSGSNPGGEYEAPDGTHYFIKQSKSDLHAKNEILASDIYQAAGIDSLELGYAKVSSNGKLGTIAPMIADAKNDLQSKLSSDLEYKKQFQKGWAVDAWLGNWDVVGLEYDNAVTDGQGKAIRVDPGGALLFRAMGSPKTDAMFGDSVGEWDSMRTDPNNYQTNDAFGDMTNDQIKESVSIVAGFTDKIIDDLVNKHDFDAPTAEKLKTRLKNRRDDLVARAAALPGNEPESQKPLEQWEEDLLNSAITPVDEPIDDEETEITNESVQPSPPMPTSLDSEEALKVLKEKLLSEPVSTPEEPLAEWEKELLGEVAKEEQAATTETTDPLLSKPGTMFKLANGQDAVVGKYNTEISYGVSVDYFKKNEKKSGIVSNIMFNQQSAKVLWPDGSSSIIKGSQLVGKGKPAASTPEQVDTNVPAPTVEPVTVETPASYTIEKWGSATPTMAADLPVGTAMSWQTDEKKPNKYGWEKIDTNLWVSISTKDSPNPITYPDKDMDDAKSDAVGTAYVMYIPAYDKDMPATEEVEETTPEASVSEPSTTMNWLQQQGEVSDFPVGTEMNFSNGHSVYKKVGENDWVYSKNSSDASYTDMEMEYLNKEATDIVLPEKFTFFEPDTKKAEDYPVGSVFSKNKAQLTKTDDHTWSTQSNLLYTNDEINALSMPSTWIAKEGTGETKTDEKSDLFTQIESAVSVFEKVYDFYVEGVGEENSSWDQFTDEFQEYIPADEENSVTIADKKFFIVPDNMNGPTYEVAIKDEFDKTFAHVPANSGYGGFDAYFFNSQLDKAFAKIVEDHEASLKAPKSVKWDDTQHKAEELPLGSKLQGVSITLEKTGDDIWTSQSTNSTYQNSVIDSLKNSGVTSWMLVAPKDVLEAPTAEEVAVDAPVTKAWVEGLPAASEMPVGTKISTGTGAGAITFEKLLEDVWSPTDGSTYIKHPDYVMENLKGSQWTVTAPKEIFEPKPEPVAEAKPSTGINDQFKVFQDTFDEYFSDLPNKSWATAKTSTPLEFEIDGQKFTFAPHPMSSSFSQYMKLTDDKGNNVYSTNDFEVDDKVPYAFDAATVFDAAKEHAETFGAKTPEPVIIDEYKLGEGKTLADVSYNDFASTPAGTQIDFLVNGKVFGTYQKNTNNSWRYQSVDKDKPSHKSESNADFKFFMENNKEAAANYVIKAPNAPEVPEEEKLELVEKPKFVLKHQFIDSKEQLADYAVGTVIKVEQSSWQNEHSATYYVKKQEGQWSKFVKTPSTVSEKNTLLEANLASQLNSWYKTAVAISLPTGEPHALLGTGEHAYVGDTVIANGKSYQLEKINKTALNLIDSISGAKVKIPAKKLAKDKTFGVKDNTPQVNTPASSKYDLNTVNPISSFVEAKQAEEAIQKQLLNFAGASSSEYDQQGLGLPISPDALKPKDMGLSVIPVQSNASSNPLFNAPKPTMPQSPQDYPSFEESVLDGLPKWDSAEWLKKVEERYLANPNKKFANVQKSTQWAKIEEVLKGNQGYSSYLNQLLSNQYIDQDLFDMAKTAIDAQEKANKPLKKAHNENVAKEKAEYEAKKLAYMADYNDQVKKYTTDLAEWSAVNVNTGALKKLPTHPPLVNNPVSLTGPADWSQSHVGTHSVKAIMEAMRQDNVLGRAGLSTAVDSDRIEESHVVFNKIKDSNGVEKFEIKFKVTHAFGALLNNKLKTDPAVNQSTGIYYPKKTNMVGKADDELAKLSGKPGQAFINSGTRFEYVDSTTGGTVVFQHAQQTGQNISVNHNSVQLLLDVNSTPADFQLVLENIGINARPSTPGALRVVAENKLLTMFSGESNWGDENFSGTKRADALKKIKKDYNITVDDVVVETDSWGRMRYMLSDAKVEEFMATAKTKEFRHSVYAGEDLDVWESILSGANPGLAANYFRGQHGIGELKSGTGMSPDKDMSVGSGAGIFITAHTTKESSAPYNNMIGVNAKSLMRRLDTWANMSDNYGKNDKGAPTPFKLMKSHGSFHEIIVRDGVPISDFSWVTIGSTQSKKKLIERLTAKGIFLINGIPLEKFILTNNETITPITSMNSFGTGVAPSAAV